MVNTYEGLLTVNEEKFCIVISRFNEFIGGKLLSGAIDELKRHGVEESNIDVVWCPGAFEIPLVAKKCASSGNYSAIITLGAVIKGSVVSNRNGAESPAHPIIPISIAISAIIFLYIFIAF